MAIVFQIERAGKNVRISGLKVWFHINIKGSLKLGTFGDLDYYAFKCPNHGLVVDYEHGYYEDHYFLRCDKCQYKHLLSSAY